MVQTQLTVSEILKGTNQLNVIRELLKLDIESLTENELSNIHKDVSNFNKTNIFVYLHYLLKTDSLDYSKNEDFLIKAFKPIATDLFAALAISLSKDINNNIISEKCAEYLESGSSKDFFEDLYNDASSNNDDVVKDTINPLKPNDLVGKSFEEQERLLSEEAIRLGFVKGLSLTLVSASETLYTIVLNGKFRASRHNNGNVSGFHALSDQDVNTKNWGLNILKESMFADDTVEFTEIPWVLYDGRNTSVNKHIKVNKSKDFYTILDNMKK